MEKPFIFKNCLAVVIRCYLLAGCLLSIAYADADTEQQVKISFIYNFAKFVTWPNISNADTTPLNFCVIGSQALAENIVQLHNKKVNERTIQVRRLSQEKPPPDCNIVFISESEAPHWEKKLSPLATLPVLTISTIPDFIQAGGIIGLKVLDNRVRFDINLLAAQKAGLSVNGQLSNLADEVIK